MLDSRPGGTLALVAAVSLAAVTSVTLASRSAARAPTEAARAAAHRLHGRSLGTPVYGVTVDDIDHLAPILTGLHALPDRATARVYFDVGEPATYYRAALAAMRGRSYIMGELLDSSDETRISTAGYARRVRSYIATLGSDVDVWEIGNEVNGNWTGPYPVVAAKLVTAYRTVAAAGGRTALTLYYDIGCGNGPDELDPLTFTRRYIPDDVRRGLSYVWLSYYEQDCGGIRPTATVWRSYFRALHALYPHARLGFGEVGLRDPVDVHNTAYGGSVLAHYYSLRLGLPYYVGGYFWWYWAEDCLPAGRAALWPAIRSGFGAERLAFR